jgi:ABC-type Co2+ transport system permease subunit
MNTLFDICVEILKFIGEKTGLGYKAANIWIFVIIHPFLTLYFFYLYRKYKKLHSK